MTGEATTGEKELASLLHSLGNPVRLQLLYQLRAPRALGEIRLQAQQAIREGEVTGRTMSRQAVAHHLRFLLDAGLVRAQERVRDGGVSDEYVVSQPRIFAMVEEVRRLVDLHSSAFEPDAHTSPLEPKALRMRARGPMLVMVHGCREGTTFPLGAPGETGVREWIVGRRRDIAITLDYDPFISSENARLERDATGTFWIEDLGSRNGTSLNWERIEARAKVRLEHGDVLGVGRSFLMFRT